MSNNSYYNDQWRIINEPNQNKVSNYSMEFDGSSDLIDCGNDSSLSPTSQLSVSAWVNNTGTGSGTFPCIISNVSSSSSNGGFVLSKNSNKWKFYLDTTGSSGWAIAVSNGTVVSNSWQHLCVTWDGSTVIMYLNGQAQTTTASASQIVYNANTETIIGEYAASYFQGKIDQVSIFDYALPATGTNSVATLYGGGTAITNPMSLSPKPIAYYQLGDQSVDNGANYLVPNNSLSDYVFNFDGVNDYIDTPQINLGSTNTISFWINTTTTTQGTIFGDPNGYADYALFSQPTLNRTAFRLGNNDSGYYQIEVSSGLLNDGNWHHHCLTRDGVTINYYIDGILQTNVINNTLNASAGTNTTIENIFAMPNGTFEYGGKLSNVALFNSALTSLQVQTIYNNGSPNDISSLSPVAWYKLNAADTFDGTDWTINDYGSGGNDGTSSNMFPSNLVVSDLQQTSGYSPYALDFDGVNDYLDCGNINSFEREDSFSGSCWVNLTGSDNEFILSKQDSTAKGYMIYVNVSRYLIFYITSNSSINKIQIRTNSTVSNNTWNHLAFTYNGSGASSGVNLYINGINQSLTNVGDTFFTGSIVDATIPFQISGRDGSGANGVNGSVSNVSMFDYELNSTQVTEIFNEGRPSDLNNFSGTAPVSWWQLGSNSSFNTNWTCLDEIGTNNAVSANMTNDDIVDGVGYSASGLGSSSIDIKGDAPYSTANGLSENMDVLDRTTDVPS